MAKFSNVPAELPHVDGLATRIMDNVDHMAFLINNELEVKKWVKKGLTLAIIMTIKACAKEAKDYSPIGFKERDQVQREIEERILALLK